MLKPYQSLHYNLFQNTLHLMGNLEQKKSSTLERVQEKRDTAKNRIKILYIYFMIKWIIFAKFNKNFFS